jgi:hypothetical protein
VRPSPQWRRDLWRTEDGLSALVPTEGDIVTGFARVLSSCSNCGASPVYCVDGKLFELLDPPTLLTILRTVKARRHTCPAESVSTEDTE